jgi:DNA-directed RNA polymerase subunit E'/Rpb7
MVVFRPYKDEVILGRIISSTKEGINGESTPAAGLVVSKANAAT